MVAKRLKPLLVAAFSLGILFFSNISMAQDDHGHNGEDSHAEREKLNPAEIILDHVADGHEYHFGKVSVPLPVILYSSGKGLSVFMSSAFHHGEKPHEGYVLMTKHYQEEHQLNEVKDKKGKPVFKNGKIYALDA